MIPLLEFKKVAVLSRNGYRLEDINLQVNQGEQIAVIGKSGAGKTTLMSLANGSLKPSKGEVLWRGLPIYELNQRQRTCIGSLWQDLRLIEELNVIQNINAGALGTQNFLWALANLLTTVGENKCKECLNLAGLKSDLLLSQVKELSGGQRQRVAIARLFRQNPEIILADEPLASLDPILSEEILGILLNKKNDKSIPIAKTIIISLHQIDHLSKFKRIIGLNVGNIAINKPFNEVNKADIEELYK